MAGKWKFQQKRWSFFGFSHGSDILMRMRESMCSGYGWVIDLHFDCIAGWSAKAVLDGGMVRLPEKKVWLELRGE